MEAIWLIIIGLIFVGIGGAAALSALVDLRRGKRTAAWPQVKGKVLTSCVVESHSESGTSYSARVKYEYAVDSIRHTSDRIKFGWESADEQSAKGTAERYPAGSPVTVYHEPQEPSLSVLEREIQVGSDIFVLLFALVVFGVGTYVWLGLFRD